MLSFARFDLSESSYGLLLMAQRTPAWREVYTRILDELIRRHTTFWAAVDWLTQIGPDPDRARYPRSYRPLIPKDLWGQYDVPGWTANGVEPWGLQPDPVGSDGNLFFRGFLTLMLGIHRAVSGEATWERPFEVVGLEDRTFPWTHAGIARFLSEQWERVPHGPHCENTKVWPYCLSAAALGLQMTDLTTGSRTHHAYGPWVDDFLRKRYLGFDARERLRWVGMYYDPLLDRVHETLRAFALAPAFYVTPQNRAMGELLYRSAVASVGWDRRWLPVLGPADRPRMMSLGLLLAREFGDETTARRLERKLARIENGRFFDGEGEAAREAPDGDEFGFFFRFGEPWPRGQESALLMLRDLLDNEGDWWRACNEHDATRFSAPTVEGVDYPRLGLATAWNDPASGELLLETYAATRSERGGETRFRITNLPDAGAVHVRRDGTPYAAWHALAPDTIELTTEVGEHHFEIHTGYRPDAAGVPDAAGAAASATAAGAAARSAGAAARGSAAVQRRAATRARTRVSPLELAVATTALRSAAGCPCCAGS